MTYPLEHIIGKYKVTDYTHKKRPYKMITDNPLEAMWEANKNPSVRVIENICGEREFYKDETGRYRLVKQ